MKFWIVIACAVAISSWAIGSTRSDVRLFCSYGRVFIEFQEGFTTWGTIMLDDDGLPLRCNDKEMRTKTRNTKEMI